MTKNQIKYSIEQNLIDFYLSWKSYASVHFFENEMFSSIRNTKHVWPNYILNKKLLKTEFTALFNAVKQLLQRKNSPKFWLLNSDIAFENETLLRNDFFFPVKVWTGMFLEKKTPYPENNIDGFKIEKITQFSDLQEFVNIINDIVFRAKVISSDLFKGKVKDKRFQLYSGKYNDEIVATLLIFYNGETTGIYYLANKETYRKRGFAGNIVKRALNDSIEKGNRKFVLHATKDALSLYKKLGFVEYMRLITFASAGFQSANQIKENE